MKASAFSDAQKAFILKQGADGVPVSVRACELRSGERLLIAHAPLHQVRRLVIARPEADVLLGEMVAHRLDHAATFAFAPKRGRAFMRLRGSLNLACAQSPEESSVKDCSKNPRVCVVPTVTFPLWIALGTSSIRICQLTKPDRSHDIIDSCVVKTMAWVVPAEASSVRASSSCR